MNDYLNIINKYYESGSRLREILIRHSQQVVAHALDIVDRKKLPLCREEVEYAGMLHDVGIYLTNAPSICCNGTAPYICHGTLGAQLLRDNLCPEFAARVAERHTGAGLTAQEIISQKLPLPHQNFLPETLLEKLICYSDKFFSKSGDMQEKSLQKVMSQMSHFGDSSLERFLELHKLFS